MPSPDNKQPAQVDPDAGEGSGRNSAARDSSGVSVGILLGGAAIVAVLGLLWWLT